MPKKVHLTLKSVMRDSYDSLHTVAGPITLDIDVNADTVETFKGKALGLLGEYAELYDVHHTKCRFLLGAKVISADDDGKICAQAGIDHDSEIHVVLPIGHDAASSPLKKPVPSASASTSAVEKGNTNNNSKHTVNLHLKSVMKDSYDSFHTVTKSELQIDLDNETVESFKVKALAVLGEFAEIRDVHHTKCRFTVNTTPLDADKDGKKCKEVGLDHECEVHVILPIGHDSILAK